MAPAAEENFVAQRDAASAIKNKKQRDRAAYDVEVEEIGLVSAGLALCHTDQRWVIHSAVCTITFIRVRKL